MRAVQPPPHLTDALVKSGFFSLASDLDHRAMRGLHAFDLTGRGAADLLEGAQLGREVLAEGYSGMDNVIEIGGGFEEEDEISLRRLREGDQAEWKRAFDDVWKLAVGNAYLVTGDRALAEDAAVAAILEITEKIVGRTADYNDWKHAKSCIVIGAKWRAIDIVRKRAREEVVIEKWAAEEEMKELESVAIDDAGIARALEVLDDEERRILFLRHWKGHTFREIAAMLGKKLSYVASKYYRALIKVRKELEKWGDDEKGGDLK